MNSGKAAGEEVKQVTDRGWFSFILSLCRREFGLLLRSCANESLNFLTAAHLIDQEMVESAVFSIKFSHFGFFVFRSTGGYV